MHRASINATLLIGAISAATYADEYYRWVDENGTIHLSDTKPSLSLDIQVDVTPLLVPKNQTRGIEPPAASTPESPEKAVSPPVASLIQLLSPKSEATIRNNEGNISLNVATNAPLGEEQSLRVLLDGKVQPNSHGLELTNINRGSHTIEVQLTQNGKVIASSDPVTVFLHRAIQQKAAPKGKPTPL